MYRGEVGVFLKNIRVVMRQVGLHISGIDIGVAG
jgi:hypothetical protein